MIREFMTPTIKRRTVYSMDQLRYFIMTYNRKDDCYMSIYKFKDSSFLFNSAIVDKIFIDLDPMDNIANLMSDFMQLHLYLTRHEILHYINFSGGGFHFFIPIQNCESINALYLGTMSIIEESGIMNAVDPSVIGDYRQVARIPFTYNIKRDRYCVPVCEIHDSYDYYVGIAENPTRNGVAYFGKKVYDVDIWNYNSYDKPHCMIDIPDAEDIKDPESIDEVLIEYGFTLDDFNEYTKRFISNKTMGYHDRGKLMIFLRNKVFLPKWTPELVEEDKMNMLKFMKAVLSEEKFKHFLYEKEIKYIFKWNYNNIDEKLGFKER